MTIRTKIECSKCLKLISKSNFKRHIDSCSGLNSNLKKIRGVDFDPNIGFKNGTRTIWNKGLTKEDSRVQKYANTISKNKKGLKPNFEWTEELRKKQSDRKKELYINYPEKHPNRKLASNRNNWTYPEKIAAKWLDDHHFKYEKNKNINGYYPDFLIDNIIIEIDGEYFHNNEKDAIRDEKLKALGYTIYRIKAKERIEERLKDILGVG